MLAKHSVFFLSSSCPSGSWRWSSDSIAVSTGNCICLRARSTFWVPLLFRMNSPRIWIQIGTLFLISLTPTDRLGVCTRTPSFCFRLSSLSLQLVFSDQRSKMVDANLLSCPRPLSDLHTYSQLQKLCTYVHVRVCWLSRARSCV